MAWSQKFRLTPESESDKKIRLWQQRLLVVLGICLRHHSQTSDSLRLRLRNPIPWLWFLKKRFLKRFQSRVRHFSCRALQSYNSPGDWARELFKPSTDSASLVVKIEKKFFRLGFELFWGERHKQGCFCVILAIFAWPCAPSQWVISWTQSLVEN